MIPAFPALEGSYAQLLDAMTIRQAKPIFNRMTALLKNRSHYDSIAEKTEVPTAVLIALNERESSSNFSTYLGNGDPLRRRTVHVPSGRGPFKTWEDGAEDALYYDGIVDLFHKFPVCLELAAYVCERWNGWGYRSRGIHSPYLFAGTNLYSRGKFTSDHGYDSSAIDTQFGCMPMIVMLGELAPDLKLPRYVAPAPAVASAFLAPAPVHDQADVQTLQRLLNLVTDDHIAVDGHYGRMTRGAVIDYQKSQNVIAPDGVMQSSAIPALVGDAILGRPPGGFPLWLAQEALDIWGAHPPLVVDGQMGPRTAAELCGFQDTNNLEMSGTLSQETIEAMQDKIRRGV